MPALLRMCRTALVAFTPGITIRHEIMLTIAITSIAGMTITPAIPTVMTTAKARPKPGRRRADNNAVTPAGDDRDMPQDEAAALYRLMTWLSPSFPVGAFSY